MNSVTLQGNLASDPQVRDVNTTQVASFTIAVSERYKKKNGEYDDDVQFIDCEAWDSGASTIGKFWKKGDPVLVQGRLKKDSWEKDGVKQFRLKVRVNNFKKFSRYQKSEDESGESQREEVGATSGGEDIPF